MVRISIVGGSGYAGGELLRILLDHPHTEIVQVTSERFSGKPIKRVHPHLRGQTSLSFSSRSDLEACDVLFLCTPHGHSMSHLEDYQKLAPRIIDLSADFRLNDPKTYEQWYGGPHVDPQHLSEFVYGIPELHRDEMRDAKFISSAGCNATATILALHPLAHAGLIDEAVVEVKVGSSEAGNSANSSSHYSERANVIRSFKPTAHRHTAEIVQELSGNPSIHFSATSIDLVRGVLATCHAFLKEDLSERDLFKLYRNAYADSPFVRVIAEKGGNYRYPEPKLLWGTNYCDIGFEKDPHSNRVVIISAIDNLVKGAAGQAVQAYNLMHGWNETTGLTFSGLHPI